VSDAGERPAPALWLAAAREGLFAFGVLAAVGIAASVAVWLIAGPAYGFGVAVRIGAMYLGAFHHVPIRIEGVFDIGRLTGGVLPNSDAPTQGTSFIEVGVALLAVTALAGWLLFRAGGRLAGSADRPWWRSALRGAGPAPVYAAAMLLVALLVRIEEPFGLGRLVEGNVRVSMAPLPAFGWSLGVAGVAGAAGGAWSSLRRHPHGRAAAALAGGWRMLWVGLALSYAGLFVAGVVQPDGAVAALTPSTARYFRTVFEHPEVGAVILPHHLALAPNEAAWTLVPAIGACDVVRGTEEGDLVCLRGSSSPTGTPVGLPAGYRLFLLVPAAATVLGGREAARRLGSRGRAGAGAGALAGAVFAVLLGATALLSGVRLVYGATVGSQGGGGSLWIGPQVVISMLLGLAWGAAGGALGGATAQIRSGTATRSAGSAPR